MDMELIKLRSCCYCMPLSTGLLYLGYMNLVFLALTFMITAYFGLFLTVLLLGFGGQLPPFEWWLIVLGPLLLNIAEVVLTVLLLVATYKKDARLLKISLVSGLVLWIFTALRSGFMTYLVININHTTDSIKSELYAYLYAAITIIQPFILGYELLLVRSLRLQLRGESEGLLEEPGVYYARL